MKIISLVISAALVAAASGGAFLVWHSSDIERAKRDIRESLVDPQSAIFSNVEKCDDNGSLRYVTGLVNSRNKMGGMTGKTRFVAVPVGNGFRNDIAEGDPFDNPNLAHLLDKARTYAATHKMTCAKIIDLAYGELSGTGAIDPKNPPMVVPEGMDPDPLSGMTEDEIVANIEPLPTEN